MSFTHEPLVTFLVVVIALLLVIVAGFAITAYRWAKEMSKVHF